MKNVVADINIGHDLTNIRKLVNVAAEVIGIDTDIYIMPLKLNFDENAYTVLQGGKYIIFVSPEILQKDRITYLVIRMFIHELWHVKQMLEGWLTFNKTQTIATWNDESYTVTTKHKYRPWELEARQAESKYYKQVKQKLTEY